MKKIVVFTGAGVSADSGLATFRDSDGLWASYRIEDVCTPEALAHNRAMVIGFYNMRRREMLAAQPNAGHEAIAGLERDFEVEVLTQNVDDLHERAGSSKVTHLHGELTCLRSSRNPDLVVPIEGWEQKLDATAPDGALLRPHIVFFGEAVPMFERAAQIARTADIMVVVGTSLAVYPAASLVRCVRPDIPVYVVDPGRPAIRGVRNPLPVFWLPAFPGRTLRFRLALARIHSYSDPAHSISGPFRTASSGRALRPITRLHVCPFRVTMRLCNAVGFGPVGVPAAVPA